MSAEHLQQSRFPFTEKLFTDHTDSLPTAFPEINEALILFTEQTEQERKARQEEILQLKQREASGRFDRTKAERRLHQYANELGEYICSQYERLEITIGCRLISLTEDSVGIFFYNSLSKPFQWLVLSLADIHDIEIHNRWWIGGVLRGQNNISTYSATDLTKEEILHLYMPKIHPDLVVTEEVSFNLQQIFLDQHPFTHMPAFIAETAQLLQELLTRLSTVNQSSEYYSYLPDHFQAFFETQPGFVSLCRDGLQVVAYPQTWQIYFIFQEEIVGGIDFTRFQVSEEDGTSTLYALPVSSAMITGNRSTGLSVENAGMLDMIENMLQFNSDMLETEQYDDE